MEIDGKKLVEESQKIRIELEKKHRCSPKEWAVFEKKVGRLSDAVSPNLEGRVVALAEENLAVAASRLKHLTPSKEKQRKMAHLERKLMHHVEKVKKLKGKAGKKGSASRSKVVEQVTHERRKIRSILKLLNSLK